VHPIVTTLVVVVTANHYWTDVVAGAVLVSLGWWLAGMVRPVSPVDAELDLLADDVVIDLVSDTQDEIVLS
jgi:cytochrome c biogenesis protein CcdA